MSRVQLFFLLPTVPSRKGRFQGCCCLGIHCKFGPYLSEALHDRFVCDIRHEGAQKRLLTKANVTSVKAIDVATGAEAAEKSAQQLRGAEQLHMGQVSYVA